MNSHYQPHVAPLLGGQFIQQFQNLNVAHDCDIELFLGLPIARKHVLLMLRNDPVTAQPFKGQPVGQQAIDGTKVGDALELLLMCWI